MAILLTMKRHSFRIGDIVKIKTSVRVKRFAGKRGEVVELSRAGNVNVACVEIEGERERFSEACLELEY